MTYALAAAAQEIGMMPEEAVMWANAPQVHAIIQVKSNGLSGQHYDGTMSGVGGLTDDMYRKVMGESWSPDKGLQWELMALLAYRQREGGGDPIKALNTYRDTGWWGGGSGDPVGPQEAAPQEAAPQQEESTYSEADKAWLDVVEDKNNGVPNNAQYLFDPVTGQWGYNN
jgi:hypothetical protein